MRLWLDTEYNGFRGALISIALVDENGRHWYEVLPCADPNPWVCANVIPALRKRRITRERMTTSLFKWLKPYVGIHVVADWPEDFVQFCSLLVTGPGRCLHIPPLTMQLVELEKPPSMITHNALEDARALRLAHMREDPRERQ